MSLREDLIRAHEEYRIKEFERLIERVKKELIGSGYTYTTYTNIAEYFRSQGLIVSDYKKGKGFEIKLKG